MARIVVFNSLSLDGVMQAPGRPDEDPRGGFPYGGWAAPYADPVIGAAAAQGSRTAAGLLFGRRTYMDFYAVWPNRTDNPFTEVLNNARKFVASRTLAGPLPWANSTLLSGDAVDAVARLRREPGGDLVVLGSGELIRSLVPHGLIDEFTLLIHPIVLGTGRRLFADDGTFAKLRLVESTASTTGVVIATYQPVETAA